MTDQVTITKSIGFLERLKGSFKNIGGGILMVIIASCLLYRNEGSSVQTANSLAEVRENVVTVPAATVNNLNEGKLVYTQGKIATDETLSDADFGISGYAGIIQLERNVEMYQRTEESKTETKEKLGGSQEETTTYSYKKIRSDEIIDSSTFQEQSGHKNPEAFGIEPLVQTIQVAKLGAFSLHADHCKQMNWKEVLSYTPTFTKNISETYVNRSISANNKLYIAAAKEEILEEIETTTGQTHITTGTQISSGQTLSGEIATGELPLIRMRKNNFPSPENPTIGDLRLSWTIVPVDEISLIAEQSNDTFRPYTAKAGDSIFMITRGNIDADTMISSAESNNIMKTWAIRIIGILLIIGGFKSLLSIIPTLGSVIPFLGRIIQIGVGFVAGVLGFSLGLIVIAIARLRFRPIVGITLLVIAAAAIIGVIVYRKSKKI